ncbi:hypothetical protein [Shinella zoogloeoides]|nr:hypothetical protein [Shinella zoogloeoides]
MDTSTLPLTLFLDGEMTRIHKVARPESRIVSPDGLAPVWDKAV